MEIDPAPEEHRRTYAGASLHLADEMEPAEEPGRSPADAAVDGAKSRPGLASPTITKMTRPRREVAPPAEPSVRW